jgi:hypothetical protein
VYLPELLNVPRLCQLGGKAYWVRALDLEAFATLIGWHDDTLPVEGERPPEPPEFGSEAARKARASATGQVILVWLGLRHQGVSYEQAREIFLDAKSTEKEDDPLPELAVFFNVILRRGRTWAPSGRTSDLARVWCDEGWANLVEHLGSIENVGRLSLDQLDFLASNGKCDSRTEDEGRAMAQAMHDEAVARQATMQAANGQHVAESV